MDEINLIIDQCLVHARQIRNLSPTYIDAVRFSCKSLVAHAKPRQLRDITTEAIEAWLLDGSLNRKWAPASFRAHHRNVGFLFRYLLKRAKIDADPTAGIELPKL